MGPSDHIQAGELKRLLQESEDISRDWDTYSQFRQNRDAILERLFPSENLN